jgi:hypothetical protein
MGNPRLSRKKTPHKNDEGVTGRSRTQPRADSKFKASDALPSQPERWIESLQTAAEFVNERETRRRLGSLVRVLRRERVSITFGGHFNSGKSSVINAALGRSLLPMDDLPETGVMCVLRAGNDDRAEARHGEDKWTIECTTEAIRNEVSLTSVSGERRAHVLEVERLDVMLKDVAIPPLANWIDSPGIDDVPEMNARALLATKYADVLVWVLTSRQGLSEVEMEFLADHIARRGPNSVVFLLNVFLAEHELTWKAFLSDKLPRFLNKLRHHATELGFTDDAPPETIPLDALKLRKSKTNGYGRAELNRLLLSLNSCKSPRVVSTRLYHAQRELAAIGEHLKAKLNAEEDRLAAERLAIVQRTKEEAERQRPAFLAVVEQSVNHFIVTSAKTATNCGAVMLTAMDASPLRRDDSYSKHLSEAIKHAVGARLDDLLQAIDTAAAQHKQTPLDQKAKTKLRQMLKLPRLTVTVPDTPIEKAIPGLLGLIQKIELFLNPLESAYGGRAVHKAIEADIAGTRSNVMLAADKAATALRGKKNEVKGFILQHCTPNTVAMSETQPEESLLVDLKEDLKILGSLAEKMAAIMSTSDAEPLTLDLGGQPRSPAQAPPTPDDNVLELQ